METALVLVGLMIVPSSLYTFSGIGQPVAILGLLTVVAIIGSSGPISIARLGSAAGASLAVAIGFAVAYDGMLLSDLLGRPLPTNPYWIFVFSAIVAGGWSAYHLGSFAKGVLAAAWALVLGTTLWSIGWMVMVYATWGTASQYAFWQRDGAITDFHRGGGGSLPAFVLQDLQGALFWHPLLSIAIGAVCGSVGAVAGIHASGLKRRVESNRS